MKQRTINISFTKDDMDLYNELIRESCLLYVPTSALIRNYIKSGIKSKNNTSLSVQQMNKTIKISNLIYEMLILLAKKSNRNPNAFIEELIQSQYKNLK